MTYYYENRRDPRKEKYIDPMSDYGFHKFFGTEENKHFLISLLNSIIPDLNIIDVTFLSQGHLGHGRDDRTVIFDVYCKTNNGERFIIEVQKAKMKYFINRTVYYASRSISSSGIKGKKGNKYNIPPTYTVCFLEFVLPQHENDKTGRYLWNYALYESETKELLYDGLRITYIEMPRFKKTDLSQMKFAEKWLYSLSNLKNMSQPAFTEDEIFNELFTKAALETLPEDEREAYVRSVMTEEDYKIALQDTVEEAVEKAVEKAREKAYAEGIALTRIKAAKAFIDRGLELSLVAEILELSEEEIAILKK